MLSVMHNAVRGTSYLFAKAVTCLIATGTNIRGQSSRGSAKTIMSRCFSSTTAASRNPKKQHHHHKPGFRARAALAQELLRTHGYRLAQVNPLRVDGLMTSSVSDIEKALPPLLRPLMQPIVEARSQQQQKDGSPISLPASLVGTDEEELMQTLLQKYCGSGIGYEFMHCATEDERSFFVNAIESTTTTTSCQKSFGDTEIGDHDKEIDLWCFEQVFRAGEWERLLEKRYPTCRRFSLEGLEAGIIAVNEVVDEFTSYASAAQSSLGHDNLRPRVVMGSLHRGRINILHTVLQMSVNDLLDQWDPTNGPTYDDITLGRSSNIVTKSGSMVHLSLIPTPAHLEAQDGTLNGKAYGHIMSLAMTTSQGEQQLVAPTEDRLALAAQCILPIILHGDASFCGQGIVSETMQLSTFSGFDCGGTVHVILNNQVGFTGETQNMRSSDQRLVGVSDVSLGIRAPVLHVNAEKPRDVYVAARLAANYRHRFGKDIVLDLWGFRKHGHNEVDEPRITNVFLYKEIDQHKAVAQLFADSLSDDDRQVCDQLQQRIKTEYDAFASKSKQKVEDICKECNQAATEGEWHDLLTHSVVASDSNTGIGVDEMKKALDTMTSIPDGFTLHPLTQRTVSRRAELLALLDDCDGPSNPKVDWATAELLALSTLAEKGHFVRLCGQDSQRGTFGQRHAIWHDVVNGDTYPAVPPLVQVVNSPLSELGCLGFEHGVSLASPNFLVCWEAQFGDFVNNSQVLIDTMISSEQQKFGLNSNLVLLLPHGFDGMGPEHSSCRLERFLSLHTDTPKEAIEIDDDLERFRNSNFSVIYPSTPANYFHVLRRSVSWPFRRPMVVLTPKRTLRLPQAASPVAEFLQNHESRPGFCPVLDDPRQLKKSKIESIALCSGEVFYDMMACLESSTEASRSVAVIRIEQLAPFPLMQLKQVVNNYPKVRRAVWVQEEPRNMGALGFISPFLENLDVDLGAPISRPVSASPAVGHPRYHEESQLGLLSKFTAWVIE